MSPLPRCKQTQPSLLFASSHQARIMQSSSRRAPHRAQSSYRPIDVDLPISDVQHHIRNSSPAPPYDAAFRHEDLSVQPPYAHHGPSYHDHSDTNQSQTPTHMTASVEGHASSRLPFFEAALARTRGLDIPTRTIPQPTPIYLPPSDPNHPLLSVGVTPSITFRASPTNHRERGLSRSPSPDRHIGYTYEDRGAYDAVRSDLGAPREDYDWNYDEKMYEDDGDLSRLPYTTTKMPSIHIQQPTEIYLDHPEEDHLLASTTQHFGPAPTHRVHRRTHNAAGHRRIKQTALLDENGFFAVDMSIPTRLAQFLPFKGVEEQKSTR